jgi:hypothetical protein
MTKESEQKSNLIWFTDLLQRPLTKATGIGCELFYSGFRGAGEVDRAKFFDLSGVVLDPFKMQFFFDPANVSMASMEYLKESIQKGAILVGYELSEQTRSVLNLAGITYIDVWLNPLRYMDDVYFSARSNNDQVNSLLVGFEPKEELFFMHADRLTVQLYRGFRRGRFLPAEGSAVFVGQTLNDKAIYRDGTMLTVLDFKEEFSLLCKEHKHVYYSRHPFVKEGDELVLGYVKSHRNVSIIDTPIYELLASKEIKTVATVSSSVASEALYFNKECRFFFKPPVPISIDHPARYMTVGQDLFTSFFWSKVLAPLTATNDCEPVSYSSQKDKIRDALSFYWGYRNIDKLESLKQTVSGMKGGKNV